MLKSGLVCIKRLFLFLGYRLKLHGFSLDNCVLDIIVKKRLFNCKGTDTFSANTLPRSDSTELVARVDTTNSLAENFSLWHVDVLFWNDMALQIEKLGFSEALHRKKFTLTNSSSYVTALQVAPRSQDSPLHFWEEVISAGSSVEVWKKSRPLQHDPIKRQQVK